MIRLKLRDSGPVPPLGCLTVLDAGEAGALGEDETEKDEVDALELEPGVSSLSISCSLLFSIVKLRFAAFCALLKLD